MSARGGEGLNEHESPLAAIADGTPCRSTTGEVNLYPDPATFATDSPILFADCEGFDGTEPLAAQYQSRWYSKDIRYQDYRIGESSVHATDRAKAAREIYPCFLYIFSDVICLVVEQTRLVCDAVTSLLKWSQICTSHVVNQYSIPSAIVIINNWDPAKWNPSKVDGHRTLEDEVFMTMEQEALTNPFLRDLMEKGNVSTLKDLVNLHYSSFTIRCIPQTHYNRVAVSSPMEVMSCLEKLGSCIDGDASIVSLKRQQNWARLDSGQMQLLFRHAFKHLASGEPRAFDFSRSRQRMELPGSATDHLGNFLHLALEKDITELRFGFTAKAIAESLVIEAVNPELVATPDSVLSNELKEKIAAAAEKSLSRSLVCAFMGPNGEKCTNTRKGHGRGHQSSGGELGSGDFDAAGFEAAKFVKKVDERVRELISDVNTQPAYERRNWMVKTHLSTLNCNSGYLTAAVAESGNTTRGLSNVPCFGCLVRKPEYRLPCGHYICGTCIERFQDQDNVLGSFHIARHSKCLLCHSTEPNGSWPVSVALQPPLAGVRVLSLDGGGTRGMIELAILRRLEQKIGLGIPIAKFFDLIIGTNAGGFIAIGLGVHDWDLETVDQKFSRLVDGRFKPQPTPSWFWSWFQSGPESFNDSKNFEAKLRSVVGPDRPHFGLRPPASSGTLLNLAKVAVTVSRDDKSLLLANYDYGDDKTYLDSRRPTSAASRATWASPYYFEPFKGSTDTNALFDGGLFYNNPTDLAFAEKRRLWPDHIGLDLLLSVGSGTIATNDEKPYITPSYIPDWVKTRANNCFDRIADTQETKNAKIRLNVNCLTHGFKLDDDNARLYEMRQLVSSYNFSAAGRDPLAEAATRLKASLFYWDVETFRHSGNGKAVTIEGTIRCRIRDMATPDSDSNPLEKLLEQLQKGADKPNSNGPFFLVRGATERREGFSEESLGSCNGTFFMKKVKFTLDVEDEDENNSIEVAFQHDEGSSDGKRENSASVSGSPFTLKQLREHVTRHLQPVPEKLDIGLVYNYKAWPRGDIAQGY
ncbi:hypothetical protein EDB80DRAFT_162470 [Ilyonectria destructans]|nr:hypothetical protein EDB80DRAFT_162470 [Ilyonectria destructans]